MEKPVKAQARVFLFFLYHPSCFASRKQSYVTCVTYLCSLILHESYHYSKPNHSVIWNLTLVHLLGTNTALSHFTFYIHGSKCTDMFKCLTYGLMCLSNHEHTGSPYHRPKWKTTGTLLFCNSWYCLILTSYWYFPFTEWTDRLFKCQWHQQHFTTSAG